MYEIGKEELAGLEKLFLSRKFFRYQGKDVPTQCSQLETEFSSYLGVKKSLFVTSGTNALFLALSSLGVCPGDEVIVPSYTFVATITAIINVGAIPVVASVGDGITLDSRSVEAKISSKTKAIIPVHMDGQSCEMDKLLDLARQHNLIVIEDVAQAIGGSFRGSKLGSMGNAGCFSFNVDKIISCGEGGMVSFSSEEPFKHALQLHDAPVTFGATFKDYLADLPTIAGHSMRMSEISAVILREQFKRLDPIIQKLRLRKRIIGAEVAHRIINPVDADGDCSTHVHLKCADPLEAQALARELTLKGLLAIPLYSRPAHCFWQWQQLLPTVPHDLGADRIHLSSIIRIAVDYDLPEEKLAEHASVLGQIFK